MAAQPIVTFLAGSSLGAPIGGTRTVTLRFDNQPDAAAGSDVGYSPYVTLVIPANGMDGAGVGNGGATANDGLTFLGANFLGLPVQSFAPVEFDAAGRALHPFATDAAGKPLVISGAPGDTMIVLRLPFGSFTPDQTPADIDVHFSVSNLADLDAPLRVTATGGFAYGRDPLVNPGADAPVVGPAAKLDVVPSVIDLDVVYVGPEQETATGPSYPRAWLVKAEIAAGQTVTDLVLTDRMPDGTFITGATILNGIGSVSFDNTTGEVVAKLTGSYTGGGPAPTLRIDFYVPEFLRDGVTPVLDPKTGAFRVLEDNARLDAVWKPTDGRDPVAVFAIDPEGAEDVITAKSIAVQKSVEVVDALKAGGTLEWTLDGQVSNYFDMDELVLTDTLGDGQVFRKGQEVSLVVQEGGKVIFSGTFGEKNVQVDRDLATGLSTLRFDVSAELRAAGLDTVLNGQVKGENHQATVLVKFQSVIETAYESDAKPPAQEPLVDQGDSLGNGIVFGGVVDETRIAREDTSGAGVALPVSEVSKSIYAINGTINPASTLVQAGDQITFRLKLDMPLTGAHEVALKDYLPLPVLDLVGAVSFQDLAGGGVPASGFAKWGPAASAFTNGAASAPTISFDDASNALRFDFGDVVKAGNPASSIDLLFTVTVLDREFGDGLLLTNQVTSTETNSFERVFEDNAIVQFTLGEPELRISKGVVADTNAAALPTLADVAPVAFTAPGSAGNRFSGVISSQNLATKPIDANLAGADAGDRVTFAIVVENTGSGPRGAFDLLIRDTLPQGFEVPAAGLNLRVTDGAGNAKSFTLKPDGLFGATGGIEILDAPNKGAVGAFNATDGSNILVITYDLELVQAAPLFAADLVNTASIDRYAAMEGGIDRAQYLSADDRVDQAVVTTATPTVTKTVVATTEAHTGSLAGADSRVDATIGEGVTFRISVTLPEGSIKSFRIEDFLPTSDASGGGVMTVTGARFVSVTGLGGGSSFDTTPDISFADTDGQNGNDKVTFDFGDVLNAADTTGTTPATVTVEVDAVVRNLTANARGDVLTNTARATAADPDAPGGRISSADATAQVDVVAPNLDVTKAVALPAGKTAADAGDTLSYTITLTNVGKPAAGGATNDFTARAWDVSLKDVLTDVLKDATMQGATLSISGIDAARITQNGAGQVDWTLSYLDPGEKVTVKFDVVVKSDVDAGEKLDNTAEASGSSMQGTTSADDRISSDTAAVSTTIDRPAITKSILATTDGNTGSSRFVAGNQDVRIGEEVTYEIRVRLPEGDSPNLRIADIMEDLNTSGNGSLTYVAGSADVVSIGSKLQTFAGGAVATPVPSFDNAGGLANNDRLTFNFGNVRNTTVNSDKAYDAADNEEFIVIRLKAVVNNLANNNDGDALDNRAQVDTGVSGSTPITTNSNTVVIDVVEPALSIDKASSVVAGQPLDAGAVVTYTITIKHAANSDAPAYDLAVADLIPAGMQLVAGSLSANVGTATAAGNAISWSADQYLLGAADIVITYRAVLLDSVTPGQLLANTAQLTYDTNPADPAIPGSPSAAEQLASRSYSASDTETRTVVLTPTIDKSVVATGDANTGSGFVSAANPDAAPGETVTYRLTVTVGEGTQRLVVSDSLPTGIVFESARVTGIGGDITGSALAVNAAPTSVSGGAYSFDFGTITNRGDNDRDAGDTIVIEVQGRVAPTATAGSTLTNVGKAETFGAVGNKPGLVTVTDDAKVDVVRPDLVIDKVANKAVIDGGDVVTYTITLRHDAGSTSAAYGVNLADTLPAGVTLIAGTATASFGTVSEAGGNIGWTAPQYLLGAQPVTITYQARAAANVVDGQVLTNTAQVTYSSAPANGATVTEQDPATVTVDLVNAVVKTLEGTSLATTAGSQVGIGEEVSFLVTATLGEGAQRIVLRDVLPTGLDYVSSSLLSLGGITGAALPAGAGGSYDAATRTVSFNLGDVVNPFDNLSTAADQVTFRVVAKVADIAGNTAGKVLDNVGQVVSSVPVNGYGQTAGSRVETVSENEAVSVVRASLGGVAWRDTNGDGLRGAGETAVVAGITVVLLNADGSATGRSTTTAADGSYLFDGLVPGSYRVRFDETAAEKRTLANQGADDAKDSDANQGTGVTDQLYTLANGQNLRGVDAGFYQTASLGDRVWQDMNGNGVQDDGATGIAGLTVNLLNADGSATGRSTVTGADGAYGFAGLAPGSYRIEVVAPGYTATRQNAAGGTEANDSDIAANLCSDAFTLVSGQSEARLDAGLWLGAKLGGTLFEDIDGDGIQDAGEGGLSGRLVTLLDASGNSTGQTRTTDAAGNYEFTGLAPGSYGVQFAPSAAQPFTKANVGSDDAVDSDADRVTGRTANVTLASGGSDTTLDAGAYRPASLGDRVWEDLNGNGLQDAGEPGIVGATVQLLDAAGTVIDTATTGAGGAYGFAGLAPDSYAIRLIAPGFTPTGQDRGDDARDSDIAADGRSATTFLSSGEAETTLDAGLYRPASIGNRVFDDANNNGVQDAGEGGVDGIAVRLLSADGASVLRTTSTAGGGLYNFGNLAPGDYRVEFVSPADRAFAKLDQGGDDAKDSDADRATGRTGLVTVASGQTRDDVDAGLVSLGSLAGRAWLDRDGNGLDQPGEAGRAGVVVTLLSADGAPTGRSTVTAADGTYRFDEVIAGDYRVKFSDPAWAQLTRANQGSDDAVDSDAAPATGITPVVRVKPAEVTGDVDAGFYLPGMIGDRVWHDLNANGIEDAGEAGIAGVTVSLLDWVGATMRTTVTDAWGYYRFEGLAPGEYGIAVTPLGGYEVSPRDVGADDFKDSDALPDFTIPKIMIFSGDYRYDRDTGVFQRASIGDRVWFDANANGVQDANEANARGVTVRLLDAGGAVAATTATDASGAYAFTNLRPGSYSVQFVPLPGTVFTAQDAGGNTATADRSDSDAAQADGRTAQVTLTSGQVNNTIDAGLVRAASIGDFVWADLDRDGIQDAEEPGLRGVTVRLLDASGAVVATTTTDASGYYGFDTIRPGTYAVQFVAPAGFTAAPRDVGNDALDSDAGADGRTANVSLSAGEVVTSIDAGFIPASVGTCDLPTTRLTNGNDAFPGTEAPDHVDGLGGDDNINGLRGDDCLRGNDGNDNINGHEGNDKIQGDGGNDNLHGNAGNDVIYGGEGNDTIEAGEDADWAEGGNGNDAMQGEGGADTLFGGRGNDTVEGNGGDDIVLGGAGSDRVAGHDGNDLVVGGADAGTARLTAGRVTGLVLGDTVSGDGGADRFVWQKGDGVDLLLDFKPSEGDTLTVYGYGGVMAVDRVDGRTVLYFDTDSAVVMNDAYPATSTSGPFPGITFVAGSTTAPGLPAERAPMVGSMGADSLSGTASADRLDGLDGNDSLAGQAGADTLEGGFGNDLLLGGDGADLIDGGPGIDTASYADATAAVIASLAAPAGNAGFAAGDSYVLVENLIGSSFADRLAGDGGANRIEGGAGDDSLAGGAGADTLVGGAGADELAGGAGADRFIFAALADSAPAAPDTITDFAWVQNDRIDLSAIDAQAGVAGDQAFLFMGGGAFAGGGQGSVRFERSGADTLVQVDAGNGGAAEMVIRLSGLHTLAAADFVL
jgi:uncharacterized repeat protein (TIGR01451 family)/fimbrial isopeptide formation D2 family protein